MNKLPKMTPRALIAACLLIATLSSPMLAASPSVTFKVDLRGTVPQGDTHHVIFGYPHLGQDVITLCAPSGPACTADTFQFTTFGLNDGVAFTYRFERVTAGGKAIPYQQGSGVVGQTGTITMVYDYNLPDTAMRRQPGEPNGLAALVLGAWVLILIAIVARRGSRRTQDASLK